MKRAELVFAAALLCACGSSPAVDFFVLAPDVLSAEPKRFDSLPIGSNLRIELRRPKIPTHLRRKPIVRRAAGGRLTISDQERWAGDFAEMIGESLSVNLGRLLPNSVVSTESAGLSGPKDVIVELEIARFEAGADGIVHLDAQVALSYAPTRGRSAECSTAGSDTPLSGRSEQWKSGSFSVSEAPASGRVEDQVRVMSSLLGELSHFLSRSISKGVTSCGPDEG